MIPTMANVYVFDIVRSETMSINYTLQYLKEFEDRVLCPVVTKLFNIAWQFWDH
jgi:hypothetical protein